MDQKFQNAISLFQTGKFDKAKEICLEIIKIEPRNFDVIHLLGIIFFQTNNLNKSAELIEKALKINPDSAEANNNLCIVFKKLKKLELALKHVNIAIKIDPNYSDAYNNLGTILIDFNRFDDALLNFNKAININPNYAEPYNNISNIMNKLRNFDEALKNSNKAIEINPNFAEAYNSRSYILKELNLFNKALEDCNKAIKISPNYSDAYNNKGIILQKLNMLNEALKSYENVIQLNPNHAEAYRNKGIVLSDLKRYDEAIISYEKANQINPNLDFLLSTLFHTKNILCDWKNYKKDLKNLEFKINSNEKVATAFSVLSIFDSIELQKKTAEILIKDKFPNINFKLMKNKIEKRKIKIGYYSADFRNHPVSYQLVQLLELHDKSKFEIIGFSFGPDSNDEMRQRISATFNEFHDVRLKSDAEIVTLSRDLNIDIAIDLMGLTKYNRFGIFVERCAPIQINFLGYSSTIGSNCIDYIIGDETLIPKKFRNKYSEKVVYLPDSFMINDSTKKISDKNFTREELGLPKDGFVFCCFNNHYKITPDIFDIWMRILENIKGSVLWLSKGNQISQINLKKEADKRNISPDRIVFSERLSSLSDHLSRHKVADLFLDTLPYNAHSTCSDALWSGLPVLTCAGNSFAARVAASMLNAINLPELITNSKKEYEEKAINFANNPQYIKKIKKKLAENRLKAPLFNTDLYAKNIENIFHKIHLRHLNKLQPEHIEI